MDSEPFLGQIAVAAFNFAPRNWAMCNGASVPIRQFPALFALIGTGFGGDGTTTFNLPNLAGRVPVGTGQGPGLSAYALGQTVGTREITLDVQQMPAHTHPVRTATTATTGSPAGAVLAPTPTAAFRPDGGLVRLATLPNAGSGQAHENRQPFLALNYCIALFGEYPYFD